MKPCVSFLNYVFNFTREQNGFSSTIDHFIVSSDFASNKCCSSYVLCDDSALGEVNFSDHCALSLSINLNAAGLATGPAIARSMLAQVRLLVQHGTGPFLST